MSKITKQEFHPTLAAEWDSMKQDSTNAKKASTITLLDASGLYEAVNVEDALREIAQNYNDLKKIRSGKDAYGTFTTIDYRRKSDNKLVMRSIVSGGVAPNYTERSVTYFKEDGSTARTVSFALTYDSDGALVSEV